MVTGKVAGPSGIVLEVLKHESEAGAVEVLDHIEGLSQRDVS